MSLANTSPADLSLGKMYGVCLWWAWDSGGGEVAVASRCFLQVFC